LNLFPLHLLAAARGDGLHPKLLEFLKARASRSGIEELALHRGTPHMQAGPHPNRPADAQLPDNVVRLAARPVQSDLSGRSKAAS